jgi:DivIVA domain-containing protein
MSWSSSRDGDLAERVRRERFSMAMRGYAPAEVDRFLAVLGDGIERLQHFVASGGRGMELTARPGNLPTAERIRRQEFAVVLNGYAMIEVDAFLEDVMDAVAGIWGTLPARSPMSEPAAPPPGVPERLAMPPRPPEPSGQPRPAALARPGTVPVPLPAPLPPPVVRALPEPAQIPVGAVRRELPSPGDKRLDAAAVRSVRFPRAVRGYARKQVDQFLERAADTIERLDATLERTPAFGRPIRPEGLTAADVEASAFFTAVRGYAMTQVDDFLDRLAAALGDRDERFGPAGPAY